VDAAVCRRTHLNLLMFSVRLCIMSLVYWMTTSVMSRSVGVRIFSCCFACHNPTQPILAATCRKHRICPLAYTSNSQKQISLITIRVVFNDFALIIKFNQKILNKFWSTMAICACVYFAKNIQYINSHFNYWLNDYVVFCGNCFLTLTS